MEEFKGYMPVEDSSFKNITELYTYTNTIEVYSNEGNIIYALLYWP